MPTLTNHRAKQAAMKPPNIGVRAEEDMGGVEAVSIDHGKLYEGT